MESKKKKKRGRSPSNDNNPQTKARKSNNPPEAETQKLSKWPRGLGGPKGMKLKQLQYHKFEKDVVIYHYCASFITVTDFRSLLNRQQHGYVNYLLGPDPLSSTPTPPGDEPPPGCLEIGYLPSVFHIGEWLCFNTDIKSTILDQLDINTSTQQMLFERVGDLPRPPPPEKKWSRTVAYTEHKDWFESLREAGRRPFRLGVTWRTWGTELMIDGMRKRDEQVRLKERREIMRDVAATDAESDGYSDVEEEEDERGEEEEQDTEYAYQRKAESPGTTGRHMPLVYHDPSSYQAVVPQKSSRSNHSRSSSNASMLSDRIINTPRTQPPSSTTLKSKEQLLLEGGYV
ncbi:uncharacterized protein ALTATR162_LOCUS4309 [Alternaria atra]|uniref:Uncharacterized protein n=1 Tax=Alternaria atra TaxID=119953 RepID=A0A8J2I2G9_9PLEO|nr:uncharacterized protein ALTATR162_LOCUS4309 [Alternaria atra]CAG5156512.1 unnamed protein product [Alternaria atra]